jgi:hypothetical protein
MVVAIGVGLLVGGACSLLDGMTNPQLTEVGSAFGPLAGTWTPNDFRYMGAVLASFGAAFATFGLLARRRD